MKHYSFFKVKVNKVCPWVNFASNVFKTLIWILLRMKLKTNLLIVKKMPNAIVSRSVSIGGAGRGKKGQS